ncbi:hypothetical protein CHU98_g5205 [Xylaria longipes]|nr:hypothetical protein CHU98_g5205 [Xylaria longipes]
MKIARAVRPPSDGLSTSTFGQLRPWTHVATSARVGKHTRIDGERPLFPVLSIILWDLGRYLTFTLAWGYKVLVAILTTSTCGGRKSTAEEVINSA